MHLPLCGQKLGLVTNSNVADFAVNPLTVYVFIFYMMDLRYVIPTSFLGGMLNEDMSQRNQVKTK